EPERLQGMGDDDRDAPGVSRTPGLHRTVSGVPDRPTVYQRFLQAFETVSEPFGQPSRIPEQEPEQEQRKGAGEIPPNPPFLCRRVCERPRPAPGASGEAAMKKGGPVEKLQARRSYRLACLRWNTEDRFPCQRRGRAPLRRARTAPACHCDRAA